MRYFDFNNDSLSIDIDNIESFDPPITVSKSFDSTFDNPYCLEVELNCYWYENEKDRNEDFDRLKSIYPKFSFIEI